jgi:hypothetical protein
MIHIINAHAFEFALYFCAYSGVVFYMGIKYGRIVEASEQAERNALRNRVSGAIMGSKVQKI